MKKSVENIAIQNNSVDEFLNNKNYIKEIEEKRISPESFNQKYKLYSKEGVEQDIKDSLKLKESHDNNKNKDSKKLKDLATISEFIIFNLFNKEKIFGDDFFAVMPSFYDDQRNQTDIIIEYKKESNKEQNIQNGAFVVDITIGEVAQKKKITQLLGGQRLIEPKYYIPEGLTKTGKFPRLILKIDIADIEKLMNFWEDKINNENNIKKIIEKIKEQLIKLSAYLAVHFNTINKDISIEYNDLNKILDKKQR